METVEERPLVSGQIADMLPEGIHPWLPTELFRPKAAEKHTTCDRCAMLIDGQSPDTGAACARVVFRPETKCCTYHPWLPSFLLGGLFADSDRGLDEGRARVRAKIAAREGVTPAGIHAPRVSEHLYEIGRDAVFGRSASLRCPYYEERIGGCSVWKYREAVCSTWFCKYVEGEDGDLFWRAVRDYLRELEEALVIHALLELGFAGEVIRGWLDRKQPLGPDDYDRRGPTDEEYARHWGTWAGREEELYVRTSGIVREIDPRSALALTGARGRARLDAARRATDVLERTEVPDPLRLSRRMTYAPDGAGGAVLTTYSAYDPARISQSLLGALREFDGRRSNAQALAAIADDHALKLSAGLLLALYRQRILVSDQP